MKKIFVLTLVLAMVLALCACGGHVKSSEMTNTELVEYFVKGYYGEDYTGSIKDIKYSSTGEPVFLIKITGNEDLLWSDDECVTTKGALEAYYDSEGTLEEYEYSDETELLLLAQDWVNEW